MGPLWPTATDKSLGLTLNLTGSTAETISTRFLCVSSAAANFPTWDWQAMTGEQSKPFADDQTSCFTARTSLWDSFIVYAVDPSKSIVAEDGQTTQRAPQHGFPHPPLNALPVDTSGISMPIYYNQPIVLQCVTTAVVSPVMIIRKVEKGTHAVGGGSLDGIAPKPIFNLPAGPGEALGDPVAQYVKTATEKRHALRRFD